MSEVILETKRLCKDYGPVRVLFDVDCSLRRGEVHALLGENGAGKSTLMKVLAGYLRPTSGQILLDGRPVSIPRSAVGERLGIVLIHQEFNLAPDLTVEENIFLGHELCRGPFVDRRQMVEACAQVLRELETDIDPRVRVSSLTVSEKQMVEIAKAVSRQARILIMDEPTAVLTDREAEVLFRLIRRLKQAGVTIVYISHKLHEVQAISDRVTVLRDGYVVATHPTAALTQDEMASLMVVRDIHDMFPPKLPVSASEEVLSVERVSVPGWTHEVSFALRRGEILGFFGLVGSGRTELMEGIVGLRPLSGGVIRRNGRRVEIRSLRRRWARRTPAALAGVLRASFYV